MLKSTEVISVARFDPQIRKTSFPWFIFEALQAVINCTLLSTTGKVANPDDVSNRIRKKRKIQSPQEWRPISLGIVFCFMYLNQCCLFFQTRIGF